MRKESSLKLIKNQTNSQNTLLHLHKGEVNPQIFISKSKRFPSLLPKQDSPGPGSYIEPLQTKDSKNLEKSRISQKSTEGNGLSSLVSKEHQWIFGSSRNPYSFSKLSKANGTALIGPGSYNISESEPISSKSSESWSKADRFAETVKRKRNSTMVGPGYYEADEKVKRGKASQMGIFKSKSPKTYLDYLERDILKGDSKRPSDLAIDPTGESHDYHHNGGFLVESNPEESSGDTLQRKKSEQAIFASKSKRYQIINPSNTEVGPGTYELSPILGFKANRPRKTTVVSSMEAPKRSKRDKKTVETMLPGPASYNLEKYCLQKELQGRMSSLKGSLNLESRFKYQEKQMSSKKEVPGPGSYNKNRYLFIREDEFQDRPLLNCREKVQVPFLSSSSRGAQEATQASGQGCYSLNQFDLSQIARKKKSHIEKLKAMDISLPGFQSSQRRTVFNLGKIINQPSQSSEGPNNEAASKC